MRLSQSVWDRFEIQVKVDSQWLTSLNRVVNATIENSYHTNTHFAIPYEFGILGENSEKLKFRVRRVWSRSCERKKDAVKKVTAWTFSKTVSAEKLKMSHRPVEAKLEQTGPRSVALTLTSKTSQRLGEFKICWKPEIHGAVMSKEYTCVRYLFIIKKNNFSHAVGKNS